MSTWQSALETLWARPRIAGVAAVHSQRLPSGRSLVEIECSGWGVLRVGRAFMRVYWGRQVIRVVVPLGMPFRVEVWNLTGREQREHRIDATLAQAPERTAVPGVRMAVLGRPIGAHPGRRIGARVPTTFFVPGLRVEPPEPRLGTVRPFVSRRPRLPPGRSPVEAIRVGACMPPVRRERLSPPPLPTQGPLIDSH
jgi:hypothetical protein